MDGQKIISIPPRYDWEWLHINSIVSVKKISIPPRYDWENAYNPVVFFRILFQFHHGTIGRKLTVPSYQFLTIFQFHHGTIGRKFEDIEKAARKDFNSTTVRLGVMKQYKNIVMEVHFNSTTVRLGDQLSS